MKILILIDNFPPFSGGGAEIACERLAFGYLNNDYEVVIATTVQDRLLVGEENRDGLKIYKFYAKYHERWRAYLSLYNPRLIRKLKRILKKEKPDIIHVHNIHKYFSYYFLKTIKQMGIPMVLTIHDGMPVCYKKFDCHIDEKNLSGSAIDYKKYKINPWQCFKCQKFRYFPLRNILIRHFINKYVDRVVAISKELKLFLDINGIKCSDIIYHGLDLNDFQIDDNEVKEFCEKFKLIRKRVIFFGGRLSYAKGAEHLIMTIGLLSKKYRDILLFVAGDKSDYADYLLNLAENLGVRDKILISDWLNKKDLLCAYLSSNIVVFPSLYLDAFGLINLEAMAMKKPVITSCFGGGKEIVIDNITGYVVNPLNIDRIAERIEDLLNHPEKAKQMGQVGYQRVLEKFTLDKEIGKYLKIFNDLCQK